MQNNFILKANIDILLYFILFSSYFMIIITIICFVLSFYT